MSFSPSRYPAGMTPRTVNKPLAAGASGKRGALLLVDANGAYATCGADPAAIAAVAATDYGADTSGYNRLGTKNFPPGYLQGHAIEAGQLFKAQYVGTLPAAEGASYGVVLDSDGQWKVDFSDTTATRVKLVRLLTGSPQNRPEVEVEFLVANTQLIGY
jgi:hypothetical protein